MERKKGSYILNNVQREFIGRCQAIHVISETAFTKIADSRNQNISYYVADQRSSIPSGAIIAARDGAFITNVAISKGAIEIIF